MSSDTISVSPFAIRHKLSCDLDETEASAWGSKPYMPLEQTTKHRSVFQRYHDGMRWEDTQIFQEQYARRFGRGEIVRGCETIEGLAAQYYSRVDGMFEHMRAHGFCERIDRQLVPLPSVVVGPDGQLIIGNQGNHRLAMAKVLGLERVTVRVVGEAKSIACEHTPVVLHPVLHQAALDTPAMTTEAERFTYYELALNVAGRGEICEIGTWLGAATCYIAAGIRDSGVRSKLHAYDRFQWRAAHTQKAGGPLERPMIEQFKLNLGPLLQHVEIHAGELLAHPWTGDAIALLVADGPKRTREISFTLDTFGRALIKGGFIACQDFGYFPAYDLPAAFARLEAAGRLELVDYVYPGTTGVFKLREPLRPSDVTYAALDTKTWQPAEILRAWRRYAERIPEPARPRFLCGAALFLCDRGAPRQAVELFAPLVSEHRSEIEPKWRYLMEARPSWAKQYAALCQMLA